MRHNRLGREEIEAVTRLLEEGQLSRYSFGREKKGECDLFEEELASFFARKHALLVNSGTNALIAALVGLGVGPGDEVIVPAYTYIATPGAVLAAGATPVIANVDASLTMDPEDAARKITERTKAILPVHMNGLPCQMDALTDLARARGLFIVEDCCQAIGGSFRGRLLGTFGDAGCFSFNHYKILSCGEGGALITDERRVFERSFITHDMGVNFTEYLAGLSEPVFLGHSMRTSEISGVLLRTQLRRLDGVLADLRARKAVLEEELAGMSAFSFPPRHCAAGDCGTSLFLRFGSAEECGLAEARLREGLRGVYEAFLPVSRFFRHVHSSWAPILEGRVTHHEASNPIRRDGLFRYDPADLAVSDKHFECSLLLFVSLDWTLDEARDIGRRIRKALGA